MARDPLADAGNDWVSHAPDRGDLSMWALWQERLNRG